MPRLSETITRAEVIGLCVRYSVPVHMADRIHMYFRYHTEPGSFLYAVLTNDLKAACALADDTNRHRLWDFVYLFYNEAPYYSWGSHERVAEYLAASPAPEPTTPVEAPSRG